MHVGHLLEERCRSGLSEFGLHHGQARVLMALDREGSAIQARLASGLGIAPATLSIMLRKLLVQHLVQRTAEAGDERMNRISLTPKGRRAARQVRSVWEQAYTDILESLRDEDAEAVRLALLKIRNSLGGKTPDLG